MNGATLAEVAEALGHKTLAMAQRYSHQIGEHVRSTLQGMADKFLTGPAPSGIAIQQSTPTPERLFSGARRCEHQTRGVNRYCACGWDLHPAQLSAGILRHAEPANIETSLALKRSGVEGQGKTLQYITCEAAWLVHIVQFDDAAKQRRTNAEALERAIGTLRSIPVHGLNPAKKTLLPWYKAWLRGQPADVPRPTIGSGTRWPLPQTLAPTRDPS